MTEERFSGAESLADADRVERSEVHVEGSEMRERPLGELFKQLSEETSTLIRQELALARAELTEKGKEAGKGAGFLGGAGIVGLLAAGALTAALILLLATFLPDSVAALIVAVIFGAIAAVLALRGKEKVQAAAPPVPEQTVETVKEDVEWAKTRGRSDKR